jgi:hypothetical protein
LRLVGRFAASQLWQLGDVRRVHLARVATSAVETDLILVRDSGRPKVSTFSIAKRVKNVQVVHEYDYRREIYAMEFFAKRGIAIPPFQRQDTGTLAYRQKLVRNPLVRLRQLDSLQVENALQELVRRGHLGRQPASTYVEECERRLANSRGCIPDSLSQACLEVLDDLRRQVATKPGTLIQMVQAHGDFSRGNYLCGDDGKRYLIDFDRSFEATEYFDAMYYATEEGLDSRQTTEMLCRLAKTWQVRLTPFENDPCRWARALFVMDLVRFLVSRFEALPDSPDRICRYSICLLERAVGAHRPL